MMWRFGEARLGWSPGHRGKGYITEGEGLNTWNLDTEGRPHHQEEWQNSGDPSPMSFLFDIEPDGGITDGGKGYGNSTDKSDASLIAFAKGADPRLYDATGYYPDVDLADIHPDPEHTYVNPIGRDAEFGHAHRLMDVFGNAAGDDPLVELQRWLKGFAPEAPTVHHDSEEDFVQHPQPTQAEYSALPHTKTTSVYYHVAPNTLRGKINQEGLQPGGERPHTPAGVYMFPDEGVARSYGKLIYGPDAHDLYQVNAQGLPLQPDEGWAQYGAQYSPEPIGLDRIKPMYQTPMSIHNPDAFNVYTHQASVEMPKPPKEIWPQIYGEDQPHCSVCGNPTPEPGPCEQCAMFGQAQKTGSLYAWVAQHAPQTL